MHKYWSLWLVLALANPALGDRAEFTLGGEGGNRWNAPLALENEEGGFYAIFGSDGELVERVAVGTSPQSTGAK